MCLFLLLSTLGFTQDKIDRGNYLIAIGHDGNMHDKDDFIATPMNIALLAEVGLWDKVVHFEYSNHIWDENATSVKEMQASVNGALKNGVLMLQEFLK